MPDHELRRELADMHQLAAVVGESCMPVHRAALQARLNELDSEYLQRFPQARERWPWPLPSRT
jgi:hypothetical protein